MIIPKISLLFFLKMPFKYNSFFPSLFFCASLLVDVVILVPPLVKGPDEPLEAISIITMQSTTPRDDLQLFLARKGRRYI